MQIMKETESFFVLCILLFASFVSVSGCFITNCPPGGKRSGDRRMRQCEQCGPEGMKGRCFGPKVCCSPLLGCMMETIETLPCLKENLHPTLCENPGEPCSGNDPNGPINGQCAAHGVCCSTGTCTLDEACKENSQGLRQLEMLSTNPGQGRMDAPANLWDRQYPIERLIYNRIGNRLISLKKAPLSQPEVNLSSGTENDGSDRN